MEKSLFTPVAGQSNKTFGYVPPIKGTQGTALSSVSTNFVAIEGIMTEGKISPAHLEFATQKLYEAKLAVDAAISYGWNNGSGAQY